MSRETTDKLIKLRVNPVTPATLEANKKFCGRLLNSLHGSGQTVSIPSFDDDTCWAMIFLSARGGLVSGFNQSYQHLPAPNW